MRKAFLALITAFLLCLPLRAAHADTAKAAYVIRVQEIITPATADFIHAQLKDAAAENASVFVIALDTPGGLMDSMKAIVQDIIASPVPVVTYVSPAGAHAASAGTYILYASTIAAMAPGTNLGAATPIMLGQPDAKPKSVLEKKMASDASAYIRSLADMRGRNAAWAEKAVEKSVSLTATEALQKNVIDVMANNVGDLLNKINGRSVKIGDKTETLHTTGATIAYHAPGWRLQLLSVITNPNITFLLMTLGFWGIILEFTHPGAFFPGITGAICILLWLYAMNVLPVNYAGLGLILLGIACMTAEAFMPTFGVLGIGGAAAFAIGAGFLFNIPGFGISYWLIGAVTLLSFGLLSVALALVMKSRKRKVTTGTEAMIGTAGEVIAWDQTTGTARVAGTVWKARSSAPQDFKKGDKIKVAAIEGLCLIVQPDQPA